MAAASMLNSCPVLRFSAIWRRSSLLGVLLAIGASASICRADPAPLPAPLMQKRCNACHAMTSVLIGPPFIAVAARHSADPNKELTVEVLAHKIVNGGGGNWGVVPMVPNDGVSLEEARGLARLILDLKAQP